MHSTLSYTLPLEVLDLEPSRLGSVGGLTFKVNSWGFWPFQLRKSVSPGGFLKAAPDLPSHPRAAASLQLSEAAEKGTGTGVYQQG